LRRATSPEIKLLNYAGPYILSTTMNRQILIILLLSVFIALLGIGIIVPIMPDFATRLGASGTSLGLMIAAFSLTRGFFQPIVGSYSDRWGRKGFLIAGLFIYGLVGLIMPEAESVANLIIIRTFHGFGSAMIMPVAMAYVSELAPSGEEGRYMGLLNIAIFSGIGGGPMLGGFFADLWGMSSAFYAMAVLSFLAMGLLLIKLPNMIDKKITPETGLGIYRAMGRVFANRRTNGILLARMTTMFIMVPTMAFLPLLMHQKFGSTGMMIGLIISVRTLINAVLQVPCGRLADRHDKLSLLTIGCLIISLIMVLVPLAADFTQLLLLFAVLGAGEALIWPVLGALATEEGRVYGHGTMMGVFNLAMSSGIFFGSLGAGWVMDFWGLRWSFITIGIIVLFLSLFAIEMIRSGSLAPRPVNK
jgi:DHA1 family multidrug resistance protein-like MFS transporter